MKRSKFSLSHFKEFTCDMGNLLPIAVIDALPGDTFQHTTNILIRCSPMLAPVMHPIVCRIHHWFVPYRLIWDDFEDFITGGASGLGVDTPAFPTISTSVAVGSLADHLGLPITDDVIEVSALPFRAYNMIYNNFYRDQDLQQELNIDYGSGLDSNTETEMMNCCWQKDYFTTARPWSQKGSEISVPINNPVAPNSYTRFTLTVSAPGDYVFSNICKSNTNCAAAWSSSALSQLLISKKVGDVLSLPAVPGAGGLIDVDSDVGCGLLPSCSASVTKIENVASAPTSFETTVSYAERAKTATVVVIVTSGNAGTLSVTDLRKALALQRFEEKRANYGSRYVEYLYEAFGVRPRDSRLQLPEYLGGGKELIRINEVLQTAQGEDPVGTMRGQGTGLVGSNRYKRYIPEHGVVLTLVSILPETMYTQGIPRMWLKRSPTDFFMKEYASVGLQEVYTKEIYGKATEGEVFGYNDRYDEYRHANSSVSGEFRSTLDFWNLSRIFDSSPVLNGTFVTCNPTKRIFASQDTNVLWCLANHSIRARRVVPKFARNRIS